MTMSEATEKSPVNKSSGAVSADPPDSIGGYMATGLIVVIALVAATGGWAASTQLAGAVLASGFVVVDSNIKKVQHPTGGIIGSIHVRDGNRVQTGDVLIRLDETITRAVNACLTLGDWDAAADDLPGQVADRHHGHPWAPARSIECG
jgi:hypothetical protein